MTTLTITADKEQAAVLRGRSDTLTVTLDDLDRGVVRGRHFGSTHWTAEANAAATDQHRAAVLPCISGESSGRP